MFSALDGGQQRERRQSMAPIPGRGLQGTNTQQARPELAINRAIALVNNSGALKL